MVNRANLPHLLAVNQFFVDLAGHARTHPETALERWWPAARCQQIGAFAEDDDDIHVRVYTPRVRPDGHGIWCEHTANVPFFAEIDLGSESLGVLVDKIVGYRELATATGRVWPVLFWLPTAAREHNLHTRLATAGVRYPVATAARDSAAQRAASPAQDVW